jgi:hypothetical protein
MTGTRIIRIAACAVKAPMGREAASSEEIMSRFRTARSCDYQRGSHVERPWSYEEIVNDADV